jgi:hypothetical protein
VGNLVVVESTNDLKDTIDSTDVRQESVTKASSGGGAL